MKDTPRPPRLVHGTPITPAPLLDELRGGSFCVSFADPRQADRCVELVGRDEILVLDNGAFSHWRAGKGEVDRAAFWRWANRYTAASDVAVAVIPDVIEGSEDDNLIEASHAVRYGLAAHPERTCFVWHMNDSLDLLGRMARLFNFVAIGSCVEFDVQRHRAAYLARLREAGAVLDYVERFKGRRPWVHLMRGLGVIHEAIRFDSADSTNVARNHNRTRGAERHVATMAARIRSRVVAAQGRVGPAYPTSNFSPEAIS